MSDRCEPRKRTVEQLARRAPLQVGDEADAACAALASGVVEEPLPLAHWAAPFDRW
jgi:hypothetical protein